VGRGDRIFFALNTASAALAFATGMPIMGAINLTIALWFITTPLGRP
jgi:hypothetical protein